MWIRIKNDYVNTSEIYRISEIRQSGYSTVLDEYELFFKSGHTMSVYQKDYSRAELLDQMHIKTECYDDF